jgi:hypothetical protein
MKETAKSHNQKMTGVIEINPAHSPIDAMIQKNKKDFEKIYKEGYCEGYNDALKLFENELILARQ